MKKLYLFFTLLCLITTVATAAPVIINGTLISWTDASGDIVIPDEVTAIADNVFKNNQNIISVSGANVITIGANSFASTKIKTVEFPKVTAIGNYAYGGCNFLTSVSFPLATTIGSEAFQSCKSLMSVSFPIAKTISSYAFGWSTS